MARCQPKTDFQLAHLNFTIIQIIHAIKFLTLSLVVLNQISTQIKLYRIFHLSYFSNSFYKSENEHNKIDANRDVQEGVRHPPPPPSSTIYFFCTGCFFLCLLPSASCTLPFEVNHCERRHSPRYLHSIISEHSLAELCCRHCRERISQYHFELLTDKAYNVARTWPFKTQTVK